MSDDRLRAEFQALRGDDARSGSVPPFERVVARRPARAAVVPRWPVLAGGVAAVLAGVLFVSTRARRADGGELVVPREVIALASWTSPTDVLLEGARMHLVTQAPALGASMVDTLRGRVR